LKAVQKYKASTNSQLHSTV